MQITMHHTWLLYTSICWFEPVLEALSIEATCPREVGSVFHLLLAKILCANTYQY